MWEIYLSLESIARQFREIILETKIFKLSSGEPAKLRMELVDGSFADIWVIESNLPFAPEMQMKYFIEFIRRTLMQK